MSPRKLLPSAETLVRVSLWCVLLAVISYTRADPDLWGHVRFGLDALRDVRLPHSDPYSFTADRTWVNHEWASEVIAGAAFHAAGNPGLVLVKLFVVGGALLALVRMLRVEGVDDTRRRDYLAGLAVITTVQQAHHVRPQLFSLLLFAVLLSCLMRAAQRNTDRWLLVLPLLFAVWANVHGGWIVGGAVLVLWTLGLAIGDPLRPAVRCGAIGAASLAATIVNPYGPGLWRFLRGTVGLSRADITEWQPVYVLDPTVWGLWGLTAALALLGIIKARRTGVRFERLAVVTALAVGSLMVSRLLSFFALATLFLFGAAIASTLPRRRETRVLPASQPSGGPLRILRAGTAALAIAVSAGSLATLAVNLVCVRIDPRNTPEPDAVRFLKDRGSAGRLLVWFDWGEYAIWHLAPGLRVSIDGRRETLYSEALLYRHLRFYFDAPGGAGLPRELAADYVWIPRHLPAVPRLLADGWVLLYEGGQSVIFGRAGAHGPVLIEPPTGRPTRCFPGP